MAAYRRVYDSGHLQADCQEPGSISSGTLRSVVEYGLPLPFFTATVKFKMASKMAAVVIRLHWKNTQHFPMDVNDIILFDIYGLRCLPFLGKTPIIFL